MNAVTAENISKVYPQGKKAVNGISLAIQPGEIYGLLGPNGAGKTTAVKLLNGMLALSGGSCSIFGINPHTAPEKVHQLSGVVTEHAQMYDRLTGLENLLYYGALFGLAKSDCRSRAIKLLDELALSDAANQKLAAYSTGMRQRLSLARAMIHRPKILFLDEPTSGLDPESAHNVNNMIINMAKNGGVTVFLCTHQLRYAQEICSTFGLIDGGALLASGSLKALRKLIAKGITLTIKVNRETIEKTIQSEDEIPQLVKNYVANGDNLYHISTREASLEEIYFALIESRKERKESL